MSVCLVLALTQTSSGQIDPSAPPKKQNKINVPENCVSNSIRSHGVPGADSYSNENHIVTTITACSTTCVIMGGEG